MRLAGLLSALVLLFCVNPLRVQAADYYVNNTATNASDLNAGTIAAPFATINRGAAVAQAGDTVWIAPGTYQPTSPIKPVNSGTSNAPITYRALAGGQVIIDGQSTVPVPISRDGLLWIAGRSWIVVDGLRVINSGFSGIFMEVSTNITVQNCSTYFTFASGIIAARASNITVLSNSVQQACMRTNTTLGVNECITMASVNGFEVAYNTVFDRLTDPSDGGEGIDAKNACLNGKIHHNLVYDLIRMGIYMDAYSNDLSNVEVYANTVHDCGAGITVASEQGATVNGVQIHDNLVRDCRGGPGIRLAGYDGNGPLQNVDVYQNTVARCGKTNSASIWEDCALLIEASNSTNINLNVRNNILSQNNTNTLFIRTKNQPYLTLDRNLLDGVAASGVTGSNAIIADAHFVDAAANDFHLATNSPAIDAALGAPLATLDHDDLLRPAAGDLGAFEWSAPLTPLKLWQKNYFTAAQLANPALEATVWGNLADYDDDGAANLLEYALGSNPAASSSVARPMAGIDGAGALTYTFTRAADPALHYEVLASSDLAGWSVIWSSTGVQNTAGRVTVTDNAPLPQTQRFFRLHIALP